MNESSKAETLFKELAEKGKTKTLTVEQFRFENEGDYIVGYLRSVASVRGSEEDKPFNVYTLDDGDRLFSFSGGVALDQLLAGGEALDKLVRIEFCGQKEIKGGRRLNQYSVEIAP